MDAPDFQLVPAPQREVPAVADPGASPFKIVVDPQMRQQLRRALIELIDNHDESLAAHYSDGRLALESYKEYIEVFRPQSERDDGKPGRRFLFAPRGRVRRAAGGGQSPPGFTLEIRPAPLTKCRDGRLGRKARAIPACLSPPSVNNRPR